ncbi:MAG: hypothetical protein PVJ98_04750 [Akkermansiaceae bacterium]|jgi:hypothetical protein
MNFFVKSLLAATLILPSFAEEVGERWGTAERERKYYPITQVPIPKNLVVEAGAFEMHPDGRVIVGTRRGDIFFVSGVDDARPEPNYHLFATGLDEIFGLAWKDGALYVTQSCELTKLSDTDKDGKADNFEVVSDAWGYGSYHEYAFGSKFDPEGNLYVALGLSASYHSRQLFRGWGFKITPEGKSIPIASGMRSPGGIGFNEHGALFYIESQGPWNCSCSLKFVPEGGFMGHPASYNWYQYAPGLKKPVEPNAGTTIIQEKERVPELIPYAVIFPYIKMGRSITGFVVNDTKGKFGPFENQMFMGDYTQSIIMRATTEKVNGVWQGACYPFREELSTGILNVQFTKGGSLLAGGTNRGWPVRGLKPYALERLDWSGEMPFEIKIVTITPKGFKVAFTKPVDRKTGSDPNSYQISTFTHPYRGAYGGPEIDQTNPAVTAVTLSEDGMTAELTLEKWTKGHCHEFDLGALRSVDGGELLHRHAYYTVNEVPKG